MTPELTPALEDYLESVYELVRDQKVARVRDIARARDVKAASVTPAMHRLAELGLIRYVQREYIDLTPAGEREARRIFARHQILGRFFEQVLQMPEPLALENACAMEHSLSPAGMDRLVRFFEFLRNCPDARQFLQLFHRCALVHAEPGTCEGTCLGRADSPAIAEGRSVTLTSLPVGASGRVRHINAAGALRDRLLDMGLLPDVLVEVTRQDASQDRLSIRIQGFELALSGEEARSVLVVAPTQDP